MSLTAAFRAEIMGLPEPERVDYALALLDLYLDPVPEFYAAAADRGLRLTAAEARMLYALERRRGRFVSLQSLTAAASACADPADWPEDKATYLKIASIRAKIERAGLPLEIQIAPEIGYRLTAPAGFLWGVDA